MRQTIKTAAAAAVASALLLAGCASDLNDAAFQNSMVSDAKVTDRTKSSDILMALPSPRQRIPVVVYEFQDQTGQFKFSDKTTDYSSAVTKGGLAVLMKALLDSSNHKWFQVAERGGLKNLLQERQIVNKMREQYALPNGAQLEQLPPMMYGGMLLEGGIIFYDTNAITGGAGARYFGIGGSTEYRRDIVTVYLRAVSVQSGEVLLSVNSSKTVFSSAISASAFRYLSFDKLLSVETGVTFNEPAQLAVRQAIETSVYSLIMEGALHGTWQFADDAAGQRAIAEYVERRDSGRPANLEQFPDKVVAQPQPAPAAPVAAPVAPVVTAPMAAPVASPAPDARTVFEPAEAPAYSPAPASAPVQQQAPQATMPQPAAPQQAVPAQTPNRSIMPPQLPDIVYPLKPSRYEGSRSTIQPPSPDSYQNQKELIVR